MGVWICIRLVSYFVLVTEMKYNVKCLISIYMGTEEAKYSIPLIAYAHVRAKRCAVVS